MGSRYLYTAPVVGYTCQTIKSKGKFSLSIKISDITRMIEFLIVYVHSAYNCILGRPVLYQLQAKISTCDFAMEILNGEGIQTIYGDQKAA